MTSLCYGCDGNTSALQEVPGTDAKTDSRTSIQLRVSLIGIFLGGRPRNMGFGCEEHLVRMLGEDNLLETFGR